MSDKLQDKIKMLVEQRIIESSKKRVTQKLMLIASQLGKPIVAHSVFGNKLRDPWALEEDLIYDPDKIPIQDPDEWNYTNMGYYFDGLKCGIHLTVTSLMYDGKVSELKATYRGYLVFAEIEGELKAYAPFPAWEEAVDMFYEAAIQREKSRAIDSKKEKEEDRKKKLNSIWQKIRMLWGY